MYYFKLIPSALLLALFLWYSPRVLGVVEPTKETEISTPAKRIYLTENLYGGKNLRFSDGSLYEIAPQDMDKTSLWLTPFDVQIAESSDPAYPYTLTNPFTQQTVKAKLVS